VTDVHSSFDLQSCVRVWNTSAVVCSTSCLEYVCCRELHILSGVRLLSCVARLVWNTSAVVSCTSCVEYVCCRVLHVCLAYVCCRVQHVCLDYVCCRVLHVCLEYMCCRVQHMCLDYVCCRELHVCLCKRALGYMCSVTASIVHECGCAVVIILLTL
jgi:hypothetical protein